MIDQRATITDVARQAGVSKATVSAVLNDTAAVSSATRDRVLAAMEHLNYRPSPRAGHAAARGHRSLALLVKEIDNPYYAEVVAGVRAAAAAHGYVLLVASSEGAYDGERRAVELLRAKDVDGLILTPVLDEGADLSHLFELKRRSIPFVLLEAIRGVPASLVDVDNVEASRRAVEYLLGLGHTRIVHFAGPSYSTHSQERVQGVRRAYSGSRLAFGDDDVVPTGAHLVDGHRAALAYFRGRNPADRPTAVTCYNDLVAIGVCRALRELGLDVPGDVSVVGFDDLPVLEFLAVPLTTVRMPMAEMGRIACEMLVRQLGATTPQPPERVILEATLVPRASTAPPPVTPGRTRRSATTPGATPVAEPSPTRGSPRGPTPGSVQDPTHVAPSRADLVR